MYTYNLAVEKEKEKEIYTYYTMHLKLQKWEMQKEDLNHYVREHTISFTDYEIEMLLNDGIVRELDLYDYGVGEDYDEFILHISTIISSIICSDLEIRLFDDYYYKNDYNEIVIK